MQSAIQSQGDEKDCSVVYDKEKGKEIKENVKM